MVKQVAGRRSNEATHALIGSADSPTQLSNGQPAETLSSAPPTTEPQSPPRLEALVSSEHSSPATENTQSAMETSFLPKDNKVVDNATTSAINNTPTTVATITNSATNAALPVAETSAVSKYGDGTMPEFHKSKEKKSEKENNERRLLPESFTPTMTVITSLAIVLGVFFIFAWMIKRAAPRQSGVLPKEVFEKLGSITFSPKMQMHLLRLGGKLVLVSVTPDGMSPVAEVTDSDEVIHLITLCKQTDSKSSSMMFRQVLKQYTGENGTQQQKQILSAGYQQQPQQFTQQQYPPQNMQQTVRRPVGIVTPAKAYQK
jgi:flagellar biogenesis protein FliO